MIRKFYGGLGIRADILIQPYSLVKSAAQPFNYQFAQNKTSISHRQLLPQNVIHVAETMDDSKDELVIFDCRYRLLR
jgi:hypothetical protein